MTGQQAPREESGGTDKRTVPAKKKPGLLRVMRSILAGALGVQSSRNHQEDFESGSPLPYIICGILFTVGFVVTLILIVRWVLASQ